MSSPSPLPVSAATLQADQVAQFLQQHPAFFQEHADLFANLSVPHPYAQSAISLGQRQLLTLRDKIKGLEQALAQLSHNATGNVRIAHHLTQWSARLLAQEDASQLPHTLTASLQAVFDLPAVALKLWGVAGLAGQAHASWGVPDEEQAALQQAACALHAPYCGPLQGVGQEAGEMWSAWLAQWFESPPASLALIALHPFQTGHQTESRNAPQHAAAFGVLVLASDQPERFSADMQTTFLDSLGQLASAALSRLSATVLHA